MKRENVVIKTLQVIGTILLLSIPHWPAVAGTKSPVTASNDLRPTQIDVDGDQNIIEKAFEPGLQGSDALSHARRSTVYVGAIQSRIPAPQQGYYPATEVTFTSQASGFLYAYPTRLSKTKLEYHSGSNETSVQTAEYNIWIITCKHALNNQQFSGIRLNTSMGDSVVYLIRSSSWKQNPNADVTVLKFEGWRNVGLDLALFEYTQAAEKEHLTQNALYEGTQVVFIGYPITMLPSSQRNYPVVQIGYVAQIQGYLAGEQAHDVFLVGGAAFGGTSGGPVLIPAGTPKAVTRYFRRSLLLGMVCAQRLAPTVTGNPLVDRQVRQNANLAEVVPMEAIHQAIEKSGEW